MLVADKDKAIWLAQGEEWVNLDQEVKSLNLQKTL